MSVRKELRAIAKDSKEAAARRLAAGRSVDGGALAPRKDAAAGATTIGLTPKGRLSVKRVGKPLGGSLVRVILRGKTKTRPSGYTTTYDGADGVALRMFHFGTSRQPARPVIGLDDRQRADAKRRIQSAVRDELRAAGLAR